MVASIVWFKSPIGSKCMFELHLPCSISHLYTRLRHSKGRTLCFVGVLNCILEFVISWKIIQNVDDSFCIWGRIQSFNPIDALLICMMPPWTYIGKDANRVVGFWGSGLTDCCTKPRHYNFIWWCDWHQIRYYGVSHFHWVLGLPKLGPLLLLLQ